MAATISLNGAKERLCLFAAFLFLWVAAVGCRLVQLQVVNYGAWMQRAQRQQQRSFEVSPARGIIYDRNGQELAMSINVDSVFAVPNEVPDHATAATLLANVTGQEPREILARLQGSKTFCWVARKVDADISNRIRALNLRGIYFQKEPKRFYPKGELAAQVLGYVGIDDEGLGGIERAYDENLRGMPGRTMINVDARRVRLGRAEQRPEPGENIVLTIDEKIQYIAEQELERTMEETRAEAATIIVQNPRTGEILALANRPTFNPNTFNKVPQQALKNRAITDVYEPGSTFKVVTIAGALEEKITRPEEVFDCQMGSITVNGLRIRDHHPYGLLTLTQVLANSSGVGSIKVGMRLGEERFDRYIRAFGFGKRTGIELQGESPGLTKPVRQWSRVSIGAISMGQEIGVTPLQLISMISTIANDGVYTPPRIVAGTTPPNGPRQVVFQRPEQRRVLSTLTAVEMKKMMESVVLFGTGRKALLDGYSSAGKTGTAQKTDPRTGRYSPHDYVASFGGFAPVNNPAVSVLVIIDSAQGLHQGGQIAAPVFARVTQQILAYLNVPHDVEPKNPVRLAAKKVTDQDLEEGSPDAFGQPLPAVAEAEYSREEPLATPGKARLVPAALTRQTPVQERLTPLSPMETPSVQKPNGAIVVDVDGGVLVPVFTGKSLRAAVEAARDVGLELDARGSGIAREQWPAAGMRVNRGTRVAVRFRH